jgi:cytochrome c biogenesis protein CcmG/thiol:disulfide interchange protein DsbE
MRLGGAVGLAAALGLLAILGYALAVAPGRTGEPGSRINSSRATIDLRLRPAAPFALRLFDGGSFELAAARGHPTLVNFWASWCAPCQEEMPALETLHHKFGGRGVRVVGVNLWDGQADARRFLAESGASYPNGPDPDGTTAVEYGVRGIPETYLIDRDARLVRRWLGPIDPADVGSALDALLAA